MTKTIVPASQHLKELAEKEALQEKRLKQKARKWAIKFTRRWNSPSYLLQQDRLPKYVVLYGVDLLRQAGYGITTITLEGKPFFKVTLEKDCYDDET